MYIVIALKVFISDHASSRTGSLRLLNHRERTGEGTSVPLVWNCFNDNLLNLGCSEPFCNVCSLFPSSGFKKSYHEQQMLQVNSAGIWQLFSCVLLLARTTSLLSLSLSYYSFFFLLEKLLCYYSGISRRGPFGSWWVNNCFNRSASM